MTAKEIREMESDKIIKNIKELKEELFNLRFQSAANKLENPMRFRLVRKDIARMMTILRERELKINDNLNANIKSKN